MRLAPASGVLLLLAAPVARADSYRLRADALVQAQAPLGVLSLHGQSAVDPGVSAEVMLWLGGGEAPSPEADALVAAVRYRDAEGRVFARAGRYVLVSGALPPIHADALDLIVAAPFGTSLEVFAGLPVEARFGERRFDWLLGGRVGQTLGPVSAGLSYLQERDAGQLADHELALDLDLLATEALSIAGRASLDLALLGLSQGKVAARYQAADWALELDLSQRSPARLLPATSLFSVLGDAAFRQARLGLTLELAPRLAAELLVGARFFDDDPREDLRAAALLFLDAEHTRRLRAELVRQGAPDGGWLGARLGLSLPLLEGLRLAAEVELVRPDEARARGSLWPWGLLALLYTWPIGQEGVDLLELSLAGEAGASPEAVRAFDVLFLASYRGGSP